MSAFERPLFPEPCPAAMAVGRELARRPPRGYEDRLGVLAWALLTEAIWAAEAALDGTGDRNRRVASEAAATSP